MTCALMCDNNFLTFGEIEVTSPASLNPDFPLERLYDNIRTRLFEFPSVFTFDSSNNVIETSVGNFTISEGSYSPSDLITELSSGNGVYWDSISYDSNTYKFSLNVQAGVTVLESSSAWLHFNFGAGDISSNKTGFAVRFFPETFIEIDLKIKTPIGLVSMISDTREAIGIQPNSLIKLEGKEIGSAYEWSEVLQYDKDLIFKVLKDRSARYLKLSISSDPDEIIPRIGMLYIGEARSLPDDRNFGNGFSINEIDLTETDETESNQYFFETRPLKREISNVQVSTANKEVLSFMREAYRNSRVYNPFFFFLDPDSLVHTDAREAAGFFRFNQPFTAVHVIKDYHDIQLRMEEVL